MCYLSCYSRLITPSQQADIMTAGCVHNAGWKKTEVIRDALHQGFSIFFTDMDIVSASLPQSIPTYLYCRLHRAAQRSLGNASDCILR